MRDWLLKLLNLDRVDFRAASDWTFRLTSEWKPPVIVVGCLALVLLVWHVYKREKGTASPGYKALLAGLRILALAVLVFALLEPAVVVRKSELKESYVIILADRSDSMKLKDRYQDPERIERLARAAGLADKPDPAEALRGMSRAEIANAVLENLEFNLAERVARNARVRQFLFASALAPLPGAGAQSGRFPRIHIQPDGPITQIGECMRDAIAELRGQRIAAVVILSDWWSNNGIPPEDAVRYALDARSPFPIFPVGVGDPAEQRDVAVISASAKDEPRPGDLLEFNVTIEQTGYDGRTVPLELRIDGRRVASENITLEPGRRIYKVSHRPLKKGAFKYVASVAPRADELSSENNAAEHTVNVRDKKDRVLLVSGWPSWEWRYLKTALARDETVHLSVWLQAADPDWVMAGGTQLTTFPLSRKDLKQYDVIFLLGASAEAFSKEQLEHIRSFVEDSGGGLIFAAGSRVATEKFAGTAVEKCLPVWIEPPDGFSRSRLIAHSFRPEITAEGGRHPGTRLTEDDHQNQEVWRKLPGLFWFYAAKGIKSGASTLAEHPEEETERGKLPIFVAHRYGAGKVFFSACDETWRWRFLSGDIYFYERFWRQIIDWAASGQQTPKLTVSPSSYTVGQRVKVEVTVRDRTLRPSSNAPLKARLERPGHIADEEIDLPLINRELGIYQHTFIARTTGNYVASMRSLEPGKPEQRVPFSVSMPTLEDGSYRLREDVMRTVAEKTSGAYFMIDQIAEIPQRIQAESDNITTEHPTEIWDSWGFLILFTLPLTAEWWLRKRRLLT